MLFDKLLDFLNTDNWNNKNSKKPLKMQTQEIAPEYLHLYNVSLTDVMEYNNHPFLIDYNNLLCDQHFKYIPISTHNYKICVDKINYLNNLLIPYCRILENNYISTVFWNDKNPNPYLNYYPSQIRFTPYTKTGRKSKYPVYVFLNDLDKEYGSYGIQLIYFKTDGKIGKADVSIRTHKKNYSFKVQVREKNGELYIRRIDKLINIGGGSIPYIKVQTLYCDDNNQRQTE